MPEIERTAKIAAYRTGVLFIFAVAILVAERPCRRCMSETYLLVQDCLLADMLEFLLKKVLLVLSRPHAVQTV